ncbi:uncharacterized protein C1orf131 homolog [Orussus abietinus]|uniref:uncharacterized protein C1orf131 homolog n=1 Tax=Orussus abietinus TaxID=222816 RepID=UPI0006263A10|nr:uncharacterized protein C1orf131 homolog [Orussus abietinus]
MEDFIETRGASVKKAASSDFMRITFESRPTKSQNCSINENSKTKECDRYLKVDKESSIDLKKKQDLEMKRARYDVIKFGMSGFAKAKAQEAKIALAVSLGAKPPKNRQTNYKILKAERYKAKLKAQKAQAVSGLKNSLVKPKSRQRSRKEGGILGLYGKVQKNSATPSKRNNTNKKGKANNSKN